MKRVVTIKDALGRGTVSIAREPAAARATRACKVKDAERLATRLEREGLTVAASQLRQDGETQLIDADGYIVHIFEGRS
jgi:hypothetical protein